MLTYADSHEDIFSGAPNILYNPVNLLGTMGAGLAKQFADRYPEMLKWYKKACSTKSNYGDRKLIGIGNCFPWRASKIVPGAPLIINLPTKVHWKDPSRYNYVEEGCVDAAKTIEVFVSGRTARNLRTIIHIPALGCGCGGLVWNAVQHIIVKTHEQYTESPHVEVKLFPPR